MSVNEELREKIRRNASAEYVPSPQQFSELEDLGEKIPKPYKNELNIKVTNTSPLRVYYYIRTDSPDISSMQNFLNKVRETVGRCVSINLANTYVQNFRDKKPGFEVEVPNQ